MTGEIRFGKVHRAMANDVNIEPLPLWEARPSQIHGTGLYARADIPAGERVIEYVGRRISKKESARLCENSNPYVFHINQEYDIDGSVEWNPARFANHSCLPNCEAEQGDDDRIWIISKRPIQAGEELTYNYGYDLEEYKDNPCDCGAPNCLGFIVAEEYWEMVRQNNETRAAVRAL